MLKKIIIALLTITASYAALAATPQPDLPALTAAATAGDAHAQLRLGLYYENSAGSTQNYPLALTWYRKAADQGLAGAQAAIGSMYLRGLDASKKDSDAIPWLQKAAEQGLAIAQYNLGVCYFFGRGVPASYASAINWYQKAAAQNLALANHALAHMSANGMGIQQDQTAAFNWELKAAEANMPEAQWLVGLRYDKGVGVAKNADQAKYWHDKARAAGYVPPAPTVNPATKQPSGDGLPNAANSSANPEWQAKHVDLDRPQNIQKSFLANNFHTLKLLKKGTVNYPKESLAQRESGNVIVWISVNEDGTVTNVTIHRSSGSEALDMAARDAAMHNVYAPYIDPETGSARAVQTEAIIDFRLPDIENTPLPQIIPPAPRRS